MQTNPLISIRGLNHFFGSGQLRKQILFDLNADVLPGEIVISTGPSGSGKTTLLTLIGALRSVEEGSVRTLGHELNGAEIKTLVSVRKQIGFIFQSHNLLEPLTSAQNVQMGLNSELALTRNEVRERCEKILKAVGLGDKIDNLPRQMSGGQKQRVAIARALVRQPKIVLADEPTASLDKKSGREVVEILHQLAKEQGCAIVMVTHDNRVLDIADRILTLEDGRISSFTSGMAANTGHLLGAFAEVHRKGEVTRLVGALTDAKFVEFLEQATSDFDNFLRTLDLANHEAIGAFFDEVLEAVIVRIRDLIGAERATIYVVDRERSEIRSKIALQPGERPLTIRIPLTHGIAGRVARTGETINLADAYSHPDFDPEIDLTTGFHTRELLSMPIWDRGRQVFAVAQLLGKSAGFTTIDEERFKEFTGALGLILETCKRLEDKQRLLGVGEAQ